MRGLLYLALSMYYGSYDLAAKDLYSNNRWTHPFRCSVSFIAELVEPTDVVFSSCASQPLS